MRIGDRLRRRKWRANFNACTRHATGEFAQQCDGTIGSTANTGWIHAALKAVRGISRQPMRLCRATNGCWREEGRFNHDGCRVLINFCILAAHHTSERNRTCCVADHQHVRCKCAIFSIEGTKRLFRRMCAAHNNRVTVEFCCIECMKGLAQLHVDVIRDVHNHIARTQTKCC